MPEQLHFDLPVRTARGRGDFVVAGPNALAVALVEGAEWPAGRLLLIGPAGAGKTHLAQVWAESAGAQVLKATELSKDDVPDLAPGATVIEDADTAAGHDAFETALFHLMNLAQAEGGRLLVTAKSPPRDWPLALPDLKSRLGAVQIARIEPPDDALLAAVLLKHFNDRQLSPTPEAISWLLARLARRFDAIGETVAALDARSLAGKREINRALVRDLAAEAPHLFD